MLGGHNGDGNYSKVRSDDQELHTRGLVGVVVLDSYTTFTFKIWET